MKLTTYRKLSLVFAVFMLIINAVPAAFFTAALVTGNGYYLLFAFATAAVLSISTVGFFASLYEEFKEEE